MFNKGGCPYGTHRSIDPKGSLPQPAWKLDNSMQIWANEMLVEVTMLNIDAASFRQISNQAEGQIDKIAKIIMNTVSDRGKQHNPVTGSGGMLLGRVAKIGEGFKDKGVSIGDRIATLVSLSLTPLVIDEIICIHPATCQVEIRGKAILFESGIYAKLPGDMPEKLALAVLDVAGAPAQTAKLVKPGGTVLIIGGGGKSGLLCLHEARKRAGVTGNVITLDFADSAVERIRKLGCANAVIQADARDSIGVMKRVQETTAGLLADVTINCVDIPGTEMASILATRDGGTVYFFSMATSFTAAALGAEGVGKDVDMLIGNGYCQGHSEIAINCLRENAVLHSIFASVYA